MPGQGHALKKKELLLACFLLTINFVVLVTSILTSTKVYNPHGHSAARMPVMRFSGAAIQSKIVWQAA